MRDVCTHRKSIVMSPVIPPSVMEATGFREVPRGVTALKATGRSTRRSIHGTHNYSNVLIFVHKRHEKPVILLADEISVFAGKIVKSIVFWALPRPTG